MTRIFLQFFLRDGSHDRLWHPHFCVYIRAQRQYTCLTFIGQRFKYIYLCSKLIQISTLELKTRTLQESNMYSKSIKLLKVLSMLRNSCHPQLLINEKQTFCSLFDQVLLRHSEQLVNKGKQKVHVQVVSSEN